MILKYGMNPYQKYAELKENAHFRLINGSPSVINIMDALNSWQLVKEIKEYNGSVAAASFKHVTPSGVAVAAELSEKERTAYMVSMDAELSPGAMAYLRARSSDRLASFGDFIALNCIVDKSAAKVIAAEVSDGLVAPGFEDEALEILKKKKKGAYVIFQIDPDYGPPRRETKTIFGFEIIQDRNELKITPEHITSNIVSKEKTLEKKTIDDLCLGMIALKYTQSNSICAVKNGQVIGIGSGQQSRILCTELALSKAKRWYEKLMLDYVKIDFPPKSKRTDKDQIIDKAYHQALASGKGAGKQCGLCLCSDGFFPQPDNIEAAALEGVKYIASPMGSIRDRDIIDACDANSMVFCNTGVRLFHH